MTERCCCSPRASVLACCLLVAALLASADSRADDLTTWVSREAVPWLTGTLASHPRFKGESVRVAVFDGSEEDPTPNLLALAIADRVEGELARNADVRLVQSASGPDWDNQRLPTRLPCVPPAEGYVVAVETGPTAGTMVAVQVRILDAQESAWVPGAVREWHGQLDSGERRKLQQTGTRDDLRGRRDLPFHPGQEDLLSARAAFALGCALLAHPAGNLVLWPGDTPEDDEAGRVALLVPRYLARTGVVRLAGSRSEANMLLAVDSQALDADTRQLWIDLSPIKGNPDLPSVRTSLYATTARAPVVADASSATAPIRLHREEPSLTWVPPRCEGDTCEDHTFLLLKSSGSSHAELIAVTRDGVVVRLYPGRCQSTARPDQDGVLRWPLDPISRGELLTVFAVFAGTPAAADALSREFNAIPGPCDAQSLSGAAARRRFETMERRLNVYGGEIQWRRIQLAPVPGDHRLAEVGRE